VAKILRLAIIASGLGAGIGLAPAAAAQTAPEVIEFQTPREAAPDDSERVCGRVHQEGRSDCTHDIVRSRRTVLAFLGSEPADEAKLTEEEKREIDALLAAGKPIHDWRTSAQLKIGPPGICPGPPPHAAEAAGHKWRRTIKKDLPCPHW
jgi:hypothetical protein